MNGTNATTFCEIEVKRQLRPRRIGPIQQKRLTILFSIKNDLFRCRNNVLTITKAEMKALRRKLYEMMKEKDFTAKENEIFQECKNTIKKLRVSHPEIFEAKTNLRIQNPSTDVAILTSIDFAMETLSNNIATESSNKSETEINHKVSRQAQVKDPTKPKQKIQKPLTDLAVISSRIDSSDTITASSSETDINNQILEVFRQAKEIIEYYSNQKDVATLF